MKKIAILLTFVIILGSGAVRGSDFGEVIKENLCPGLVEALIKYDDQSALDVFKTQSSSTESGKTEFPEATIRGLAFSVVRALSEGNQFIFEELSFGLKVDGKERRGDVTYVVLSEDGIDEKIEGIGVIEIKNDFDLASAASDALKLEDLLQNTGTGKKKKGNIESGKGATEGFVVYFLNEGSLSNFSRVIDGVAPRVVQIPVEKTEDGYGCPVVDGS